MTIVDRAVNPHASTFPSEVVTCRLGGGDEFRLFCKYGTGPGHDGHGHRGGVGYEAEVYRRVLVAAGLAVPGFYGAAAAGPAGEVWLAIGYLEGCQRLRDSRDLCHWERAAAWSGRFHTVHEGRDRDPTLSFLIKYDADYYAGWGRRTAEYAAALHPTFPWVADLCRRWEAVLLELVEGRRTVIHGEYYPKNLLVKDGTVYPVDWESAALGRGEIDLATLTDRSDPEVVQRCEAAYRLARWPEGAPPDFTRALELARLYVHLRWLGAEPGNKLRRRSWRYDEIRVLGERLGLI
jgi:aminoglycoside phosphotransferase (APT) family kinase protein